MANACVCGCVCECFLRRKETEHLTTVVVCVVVCVCVCVCVCVAVILGGETGEMCSANLVAFVLGRLHPDVAGPGVHSWDVKSWWCSAKTSGWLTSLPYAVGLSMVEGCARSQSQNTPTTGSSVSEGGSMERSTDVGDGP